VEERDDRGRLHRTTRAKDEGRGWADEKHWRFIDFGLVWFW